MSNEFQHIYDGLETLMKRAQTSLVQNILKQAGVAENTRDYSRFSEVITAFMTDPDAWHAYHTLWFENNQIVGSITIDKDGKVMVQRNDEDAALISKEQSRLQDLANKVFAEQRNTLNMLYQLQFLTTETVGALFGLSPEIQGAIIDQASSVINSRSRSTIHEKK